MNRVLILLCLILGPALLPQPANAFEHELRRFDQKNQVKKKFWAGRLGDREKQGELCSTCQEKQSIDRMDYLRRALSSDSNSYQQIILAELEKDESFNQQCLSKMVAKDVELFFTITTEGGVDDLASFPRNVRASCLKKKIKQLTLPIPNSDQYLWLVASSFR